MYQIQTRPVDFFKDIWKQRKLTPLKYFGRPVVGISIFNPTYRSALVTFYHEAMDALKLEPGDRIAFNEFDGSYYFTILLNSDRIFGYTLSKNTSGKSLYFRSHTLLLRGVSHGYYEIGKPFEDVNRRLCYPLTWFGNPSFKRIIRNE